MTTRHTQRCIDNAIGSIVDNNLDTLVERGINERTAGMDWVAANQLVNAELDAGYADGTLTEPTVAMAVTWLAEGNVSCYEPEECSLPVRVYGGGWRGQAI